MGEYDALLGLATGVAAEAATLVARMRSEGVDVSATKSSPVDVVTRADEAAQRLIRSRLLGARPDDGFLGEEGGHVAGTSGVRWVVDPIDGTVNYLYGTPEYAVSIAAELAGRMVAGVVHAPATGVVHAATLGGGSTCDGVPLWVRDVVEVRQRLILTGFGYGEELRRRQGGYVAAMLPRVRDIRRRGACALDLCTIGAGLADGYVEEGVNLWDHAAGALVATEAGATFALLRSPSGNDLIVCSPKGGFDEFLVLLNECGFVGNT
ncbi:MAG: inositol monophosphatase family protein [Marmoricola sp.]